MKNRTIALLGAATAFALTLLSAPSAGLAHDARVDGEAQCQPDGTVSISWSVPLSNYGDHQEIDLKVIGHSPAGSYINGVDGQVWLHEWAEHSANHGLAPFPEGGVATFVQTGIPGDATEAAVTVQYDWKNGPSGDPSGYVTLPGECTPDVPPVYVTPIAPELFTRECYQNGETPHVVPAETAGIAYETIEIEPGIFQTSASPVGENTYLNAEAAIAAGFLPTESQTFVRVDDLSYQPACAEPEVPVTPEVPATPEVPETVVEQPLPPAVPIANGIPELPATGTAEDAVIQRNVAIGIGSVLVVAGALFFLAGLNRDRRPRL